MGSLLFRVIAALLLVGAATAYQETEARGSYVRTKHVSSIRRVVAMLPIIDKTIIGGRHESTKDDDIPFGKKNIGGRLVAGFAKKHRITPSSSPSFYGSPAYAHTYDSHLLLWLASPNNTYSFVAQLQRDMMQLKHGLKDAGRQFDPKKCLLVVDDYKLPIGKAVFRLRGGYDGSWFLKEIARAMDISEIPRLRVGIGTPALHFMDAATIDKWVHAEFDRFGKAMLPRLHHRVTHMIEKWIELPTTEEAIKYCRALPDIRSAEGISLAGNIKELY